MNKDLLSVGSNPARLRQAAYRVISQTQDHPAIQVQGMAVALVATCQALDIDIRELLECTERMKADLDGPFVSTFDALEAYAINEIGRS